MLIQNPARIGLNLEYKKKWGWYTEIFSDIKIQYRRWSKVYVALRVQEKQSHLCIGKDRIQCRPVQEMPVHLYGNSSSSTWESWEQLCISLYFQNSVQALSWPTVQFASLFLTLFISFMPVETLKSCHFTAMVEDTWGPYQLCSASLQHIFLLGISWLSERLSASMIEAITLKTLLFLFLTCDGSGVLLFF